MATPTTSSKVNGFVVTKLQQTADRLRLETSKLRDSLRSERDAVRELRAKHAAQLRTERTAARRRQCELETQLKKDTVAATHCVVPINQCDQCSKLRASHEAELRREHAEQKKRESQLRTQLNEVRRNAMHSATDGVGCQHCIKSSKDITKLKELNKDLEERLHKTIEADKQKAADLRAQHEKHVIELSKITRIHKQDSHKLLEELKTKDRIIEQLRKNANGGAITEPSTQMRKLREDTKKTEQPNLLSSTAYDSKPEQIQQNEKDKIADLNLQNKNKEQMTCGGPGDDLEQNPETDTDSAVSSAPSSLSPQPCSPLNEDCVNSLRCTRQNLLQDSQPPTSLSPQPSEGYTTPPPGLWSVDHDYHTDDDNDSVTENELMMAKRQVRELERALLVTRASKSGHHVMALSDRVRQLEEHETELLRELGDLREQNELLEFRVFELAECHDKSSILESQWIEKHEACTGTDDDYLINQLNEDSVRNRLLAISNRTTNLEDKTCLQQIVLLLYGLDELTRRSKDVFNIDLHQENQEEDLILPHMGNNNGQRGHRDRLVAKVPPFTGRSIDSDDDRSSPVRNIDESLKSKTSCGTQTEGLSSVNEINDLSLNLTAEVRKLDRLRESIQVRNGNFGVSNFSDEQKNARQLEFYRDRVEVLERKVRVYESSGEQQVREIAERLSREVCLEAQVKQLTQTVQKLQSDNSRLEEERCELEEAENDTRLRCQRLESDKAQLERSKMSAKRKARDSRSQAVYWESMVSKYEERNYELEEKECELRHKLEVMERTFQAVLLFNMWKTSQNNTNVDAVVEVTDRLRRAGERDRSRSRSRTKSRSPTRDNSDGCTPNTCMTDGVNKESSSSSLQSYDMELLKCVQQLKDREQDLKKKIDELEHREAAYLETLQQADDIWAEMETGYKKQINEVRCSEANMRAKLQNMQKHQDCDCDQLEDSERKLKEMSKRLETEKCKLTNDNKRLEAELCDCRDEYAKTVNVQKQCQNDLVKERHRAEEYQQKAACAGIALIEAGKQHQSEMAELKDRLARVTNELFHLEVTNGELREEVDTLECKITELETAANQRCTQDAKVIRGLTDELNQRDKEVEELQQKCCANVGERLSSAMEAVKRCDACLNQVSRVSPNLMNTVEGIRTLCEIVGCNAQQPDTQVSDECKKICEDVCPASTKPPVCGTPKPPVCGTPKPSAKDLCEQEICPVKVLNAMKASFAKAPVCGTPKPSIKDLLCEEELCSVKKYNAIKAAYKKPVCGTAEPSEEELCEQEVCPVKVLNAMKASFTKPSVCGPSEKSGIQDLIEKILSHPSFECCSTEESNSPCPPCDSFETAKSSFDTRKTASVQSMPCDGPCGKVSTHSIPSKIQQGALAPCPVARPQKSFLSQKSVDFRGVSGPSTMTGTMNSSFATGTTGSSYTTGSTWPSTRTGSSFASSAATGTTGTSYTTGTTGTGTYGSSFASSAMQSALSSDISKYSPSTFGSRSVQQYDLSADLQVCGQPPCRNIQADVDLNPNQTSDGINVKTKITSSGNLEITTDAPPGVVEHTMNYTSSGNLEVTTQFQEQTRQPRPPSNVVPYRPLPPRPQLTLQGPKCENTECHSSPSNFHEGRDPKGPDPDKNTSIYINQTIGDNDDDDDDTSFLDDDDDDDLFENACSTIDPDENIDTINLIDDIRCIKENINYKFINSIVDDMIHDIFYDDEVHNFKIYDKSKLQYGNEKLDAEKPFSPVQSTNDITKTFKRSHSFIPVLKTKKSHISRIDTKRQYKSKTSCCFHSDCFAPYDKKFKANQYQRRKAYSVEIIKNNKKRKRIRSSTITVEDNDSRSCTKFHDNPTYDDVIKKKSISKIPTGKDIVSCHKMTEKKSKFSSKIPKRMASTFKFIQQLCDFQEFPNIPQQFSVYPLQQVTNTQTCIFPSQINCTCLPFPGQGGGVPAIYGVPHCTPQVLYDITMYLPQSAGSGQDSCDPNCPIFLQQRPITASSGGNEFCVPGCQMGYMQPQPIFYYPVPCRPISPCSVPIQQESGNKCEKQKCPAIIGADGKPADLPIVCGEELSCKSGASGLGVRIDDFYLQSEEERLAAEAAGEYDASEYGPDGSYRGSSKGGDYTDGTISVSFEIEYDDVSGQDTIDIPSLTKVSSRTKDGRSGGGSGTSTGGTRRGVTSGTDSCAAIGTASRGASGAGTGAASGAGTRAASGAGTGAASGAGSGGGTGAGSGGGTGAGSGGETGAGSGGATGATSGAASGFGTGAASGAASGLGTGAASGAASGLGTGAASGAASGFGTGAASGAASGLGTGAASGAASGAGTGAGSGAASGAASGRASGAASGRASGRGSGAASGAPSGTASGAAIGTASGAASGAGSRRDSAAGSRRDSTVGSRKGSGAGIRRGSTTGSRPGSKAGSRTASQQRLSGTGKSGAGRPSDKTSKTSCDISCLSIHSKTCTCAVCKCNPCMDSKIPKRIKTSAVGSPPQDGDAGRGGDGGARRDGIAGEQKVMGSRCYICHCAICRCLNCIDENMECREGGGRDGKGAGADGGKGGDVGGGKGGDVGGGKGGDVDGGKGGDLDGGKGAGVAGGKGAGIDGGDGTFTGIPCDCEPVCDCVPCSDPAKLAEIAKGVGVDGGDGKFTGKPCDCEGPCTCEPCSDPNKIKGSEPGVKQRVSPQTVPADGQAVTFTLPGSAPDSGHTPFNNAPGTAPDSGYAAFNNAPGAVPFVGPPCFCINLSANPQGGQTGFYSIPFATPSTVPDPNYSYVPSAIPNAGIAYPTPSGTPGYQPSGTPNAGIAYPTPSGTPGYQPSAFPDTSMTCPSTCDPPSYVPSASPNASIAYPTPSGTPGYQPSGTPTYQPSGPQRYSTPHSDPGNSRCDCDICQCDPCDSRPTSFECDDGVCDCESVCVCKPCKDPNRNTGSRSPTSHSSGPKSFLGEPTCTKCKKVFPKNEKHVKCGGRTISIQYPREMTHPGQLEIEREDLCNECKCEAERLATKNEKSVKVGGRAIPVQYPIPTDVNTKCLVTLGHEADCNCPICNCVKCDKIAVGGGDTKPTKGLVSLHSSSCSCNICDCTQCSKSQKSPSQNSPSQKSQKSVKTPVAQQIRARTNSEPIMAKPKIQEVDDEVLSACDCEQPCACEKCNRKRQGDAGQPIVRLPPSLVGPSFVNKPVPGQASPIRSVALTAPEDIRNLDTDTLKVRLSAMEKEAKERANEIAKIRSFMENLKCSCNNNPSKHPIDSVSRENPSNAPETSPTLGETISGLQCAVAFLQEKCKTKDRMIQAMTDELRVRTDSGIFEKVLQNVNEKEMPGNVPEFDRKALTMNLPRPNSTQRQVLRTPAEKPGLPEQTRAATKDCQCGPGGGTGGGTGGATSNEVKIDVNEVRRVAPDSLLVKWNRPNNNNIKGYEIEINGTTKSRVHSSGRTATVVHGLQMGSPVQVDVYAVNLSGGRYIPPGTSTYAPRPLSPPQPGGYSTPKSRPSSRPASARQSAHNVCSCGHPDVCDCTTPHECSL